MHVAQLNIARLLAPLDSPPLAEFVAKLGALRHHGPTDDALTFRTAPCPAG